MRQLSVAEDMRNEIARNAVEMIADGAQWRVFLNTRSLPLRVLKNLQWRMLIGKNQNHNSIVLSHPFRTIPVVCEGVLWYD